MPGTLLAGRIVCLAALLAAAGPAPAVTFPDRPATDSFVVDDAGLIASGERPEIDRIAFELWQGDQIPLVVVTIPSLASYQAGGWTIERYAGALFDAWGIGSERRNYGMLLLVSRDDRRARIELGAAWGRTHDRQAQEVMDTLIVPEFRRGDYGSGILAGVRGMDAMARGLALPKPVRPWWVLPLTLAGLGLCVGVIVSLFRSGRSGWGWLLIAALGAVAFFALRAASQRGGSGGAFGGGTSGGGGATGSW